MALVELSLNTVQAHKHIPFVTSAITVVDTVMLSKYPSSTTLPPLSVPGRPKTSLSISTSLLPASHTHPSLNTRTQQPPQLQQPPQPPSFHPPPQLHAPAPSPRKPSQPRLQLQLGFQQSRSPSRTSSPAPAAGPGPSSLARLHSPILSPSHSDYATPISAASTSYFTPVSALSPNRPPQHTPSLRWELSPDGNVSEILPGLLISDLSIAEDAESLEALGITHVLSVMPGKVNVPAHVHQNSWGGRPGSSGGMKRTVKIEHLQVPIYDNPFEELVAYLPQTTAWIRDALKCPPSSSSSLSHSRSHSHILQPQSKVLVHCSLGRSRSVSVVCAYLIHCLGYTPDAALAFVKSLRSIAEPNSGFVGQLGEYWKALGCPGQ